MAKIYKHALMQFCPLHMNLDDNPDLHIKDDDPKKGETETSRGHG
jgi:hypothetical protein